MRLVVILMLVVILSTVLSRMGSVYLTVFPVVVGVWTYLILENTTGDDEDDSS